METRFVPDGAATWLVYDLGAVVLALPGELRAVADAIAALPARGGDALTGLLGALEASGLAVDAPFALLEFRAGGVRVAVRGPATLTAGGETLTGLGALAPVERELPGARLVRLTVPGGEWMFADRAAAPRPVAPEPAAETVALETDSAARPAAPPALGLFDATADPDADDRTVLVSELEALVPPLSPAAAPPGAEEDSTVVVDEIAQLRASRSAGIKTPEVRGPRPVATLTPADGPALRLELPDGRVESLATPVVLGRAPTALAGDTARLVRVAGEGDISRTHVRVAVEGGTVVVTDLGSRNGTVVRTPGRPAQKLRAGDPTPVLVGSVIDFGGGVEVRVGEG